MSAALGLAAGAWEAALLPAQGAAFARLRHRGRDLLVPVPPGADPNRGFWGAFWMIPWANRLDRGRLPWGGRTHRLPVNRPEDDTAIHGLARDRPWRVAAAAGDRAVLVQAFAAPGIPYRYRARVEVALAADGVRLAAAVANAADEPFPFGLGWHPFFPRPPGTRLAFRATTRFGRDARTLPVAPCPTRGIAGDETAYLGLDTHFADWDGRAEIAFPGPDGPRLCLVASGAWAGNLQVFAPPAVPVLCVEPQSHVPDVANRPAFAAHGAMTVLAPGDALEARLAIALA
ncbi:aldose epimerase family protein [Caldovatus aquaticus]|uniref:Aldose epimerase n=1 Tax=Caldovatus aquaticus TaxID=2865671 RepID=A0ABS7F5X0_9PROT|nr:aldose epimerase [Caldovatus aquaticus]MBW8270175.1 aldose epimerase [Caldovatus aquaticus]